ncbi:MAG: hypothetical protein BIFFINMI_00527 [Phycisphaerae bacterium]|nr:hypothetical protein [Phycisphaerae bacterium]
MARYLPFSIAAAVALVLAGGCTMHASPIRTWQFYDTVTDKPVENVLLLEWIEKVASDSPVTAGFEQQVPAADTLTGLRGGMITPDNREFRPGLNTGVTMIAVNVSERSRFMAIRPGYGYRIVFANPQRLTRLDVPDAADESIAYVLLDPRADADDAVDWLAWLANGRSLIAKGDWHQRDLIYKSFGDYWDRTVKEKGPLVEANLSVRNELRKEIARIYRDELARPAPALPVQ